MKDNKNEFKKKLSRTYSVWMDTQSDGNVQFNLIDQLDRNKSEEYNRNNSSTIK